LSLARGNQGVHQGGHQGVHQGGHQRSSAHRELRLELGQLRLLKLALLQPPT
jgi:hypothetical protein